MPRIVLFAAGALLVAPLVVAAQGLPASAATGKLLVTTLGHTGVTRSSQIVAVNVTQPNIVQGLPYNGNSGQALSVPDGRYAVVAGINDNNTTETLAEAVVTVQGTATTSVTLDGRKGRLVTVTLDGSRVTNNVLATVCAGPLGEGVVEGFQPGGALYVVPTSSSVFTSAYTAVGQGVVLSGAAAGVPATLGGAWSSSQLAKVNSAVKSGEMNAFSTDYDLAMAPAPGSSNQCTADPGALVSGVAAPYRNTELVSPGYWNLRTDDQASPGIVGGYYLSSRHFTSGHTYSFTLYAAAWAPFGQVADLRPGAVDFSFPMFADPAGNGSEAAEKGTLSLSAGGHVLATRTESTYGSQPSDFYVRTSKSGWYTLTDDESRYYPGLSFSSVLSPRVTFGWNFYAVPSTVGTNFRLTDGFWPSIQPLSLNLGNSAALGTKTTVFFGFTRRTFDTTNIPSDSVTKVQAWFSINGKPWASVAVRRISNGWTAVVPNSEKGTMSLRVHAVGSHGDNSTETIYKAYAVS